MTGWAERFRSADSETRRLVWAVAMSAAIHGGLFLVKAGDWSGLDAGGARGVKVLTASLRGQNESPSASSPAPELQVPAEAMPVEHDSSGPRTPAAAALPASEPRSPAAGEPPLASDVRPEQRESEPAGSGGDVTAGGAASAQLAGGDEAASIPMLPPLPGRDRGLVRPASMVAPLRFGYPSNMPLMAGKVRLRLTVDERGRTESIDVVVANPPSTFDDVAVQIMRHARLTPGYAGEIPVRSYTYFDISFGSGHGAQRIYPVGGSIAPPSGHPPAR